DPYYSFSPRSPRNVFYRKRVYATAEHLFQAMRFLSANNHSEAQAKTSCPTVDEAIALARTHERTQRGDWGAVQFSKLEEISYLKFTQHDDLLSQLVATYPAPLAWATPRDALFGLGTNGQGRNYLGLTLERVRNRLKED
ncbi:DUF1768-domain-containing protein, partial [Clavulina sp. PMI_390]